MARRLLTPFLRAIGADGLAMSGAKIYFYLTGTTTLTDSYQASSGGSAHANPVVADSGGLFASIYINDAIQTRAVLKNSAGTTILDIDPVNPAIAVAADSITDTELATGAAAANLGYTPANVAGDTFTGDIIDKPFARRRQLRQSFRRSRRGNQPDVAKQSALRQLAVE